MSELFNPVMVPSPTTIPNGGTNATTAAGAAANLIGNQNITPASINVTTLTVSGQGTFAIPVSVKGIYITSATTGISDASNSQTFLQTGANPILQGQNSLHIRTYPQGGASHIFFEPLGAETARAWQSGGWTLGMASTSDPGAGKVAVTSLLASAPCKLGGVTVSGLPPNSGGAYNGQTTTVSNPAAGKSSLVTGNSTNWLYQDGSIAA